MKGDRLFKRIIGDLLELKDSEIQSVVKNFNTAENVLYFEKKGVNMKKVLQFCMALLISKGFPLPYSGYYNWGDLVEEYEKENTNGNDPNEP